MSTHLLTSRSALAPSFGAIVAHRLKAVAKALLNRRAVVGLADYDERLLKDIGLTPQDVVSALDMPMMDDPSVHLRHVAAGRGWRGR